MYIYVRVTSFRSTDRGLLYTHFPLPPTTTTNLCDIGLNRQIRVIQLIREIQQLVSDPIRTHELSMRSCQRLNPYPLPTQQEWDFLWPEKDFMISHVSFISLSRI